MDSYGFARNFTRGLLALISYEGRTLGVRIGLDSTVTELKRHIFEMWVDLTPLCFEIYFVRAGTRSVIDTDAEIQSLACFGVTKGENSVQVFVHLIQRDISLILSDNVCTSSSICSGSYGDEIEVWQLLKSGAWANLIVGVGQKFVGGAIEFRTKLLQYSIEKGFKFKLLKNDNRRVTAECSKKEAIGYQWRVHASQKFNLPNFFEIKTMNKEHTCGVGCKNVRNPSMSSQLVKSAILEEVRDKPLVKPREIIDVFQRDYGMKLNYYYAYTGKELAMKEIHGGDELSYHQLVWYIDALRRTNPGSHIVLESHPDSRKFERVFISFAACINGFKFCHPLLCLDGTFLKGKYKGCMLAARGINGNEGIFLLAMTIVDAENEANWLWFLENLKLVVSDARMLTYISDRHWGLVVSVPKVFPNAYHGYCLWHLKNNLSAAIPSKNPKRPVILKLFTDCAYAPTHLEFQKVVEDLKVVGGTIVDEFLKNTPIEHWANAYFQGKRYGQMCSNVAESFNSWIAKERNMPITSMIDEIHLKLMKMMSDRRELSRKWMSFLCPELEKKFSIKVEDSRTWKVTKSSDNVFEVHENKIHCVNINRMHCTCNLWHIDGFPCEHAVLSILADGQSVYTNCDRYFHSSTFRESYSQPIEPIPNFGKPEVLPEEAALLPPETKRNPGDHIRNELRARVKK